MRVTRNFLNNIMVSLLFFAISIFLSSCIIIPIPYKGYPHKLMRGRVIDGNDFRPIEGASVALVYGVPQFPFGRNIRKDEVSDQNGYFVFNPERRWTVIFINILMGSGSSYDYIYVKKDGCVSTRLDVDSRTQDTWGNYPIIKLNYDLGDIALKPIMESE